jgi:ATP-binding cassette subfamily C protein
MGAPGIEGLTLWRHYLADVCALARGRLVLAIAAMLAAGLVEGVMLLLLVPLLQVAGLDVQQGSIAWLSTLVARGFQAARVPATLPGVLLVYVAAVSAHAFLQEAQAGYSVEVQQSVVRALRMRLYRAVFSAPWIHVSRLRGSDLSHALTHEADRVGNGTHQLLSLAATGLVTAIYALLALKLSVSMTLMVCAGGGLLLAVFSRRAAASRRAGEEFSRATATLYGSAQEHVAGVKAARSLGVEPAWTARFEGDTSRTSDIHVRTIRHHARSQTLFDIGSVSVLTLLLFVAVDVVRLPTSSLLLLLFLFARLVPRLATLQQGFHVVLHTLPSYVSIQNLERLLQPVDCSGGGGPTTLEREIVLDRVSFRYDADRPALRGVTLRIEAGRTTAVVGTSGAGKSTLADIVLGLLTPCSGAVYVDGQPLAVERLSEWRGRIGYVSQDAFFFHDTIRANLLWARPGASDKDVERALALAAADHFVASLPLGVDTVVGDRGVGLSGGERQRLALARALLREPSLLVLDEPTSAIDAETEARIWKTIDDLHGRTTILVITHRLSNVRRADAIHVLDEGRIIESGTWDALIANRVGRFRGLARAVRDGRIPAHA